MTLLDTAGIRETSDPVELEGVRRARERAAAADLVLWVVDATEDGRPVAESGAASAEVGGKAGELGGAEGEPGPPCWLVRNKIDLIGRERRNEPIIALRQRNEFGNVFNELLDVTVNQGSRDKSEHEFGKYELIFGLSAVSGEGFDELLGKLTEYADGYLAGAESALVTRERHRRALDDTLAALRRALDPALQGREDLLAEELRTAARRSAGSPAGSMSRIFST